VIGASVHLDTVLRAEQRHEISIGERDETRVRVTLAFDAEIGQEELGWRIREVRLECGFNLEDLAKRIGRTDGLLSRIELGGLPSVTLCVLLAICDACSFDIGRLLAPTWLGSAGAHANADEVLVR